MKSIQLKKNKEKPVKQQHPWIFSGAIMSLDPEIIDGDVVSVLDSGGGLLGYGYINKKTHISVRMLSFGDQAITIEYLRKLVRAAITKRTANPLLKNTGMYRLVFSEGDFLPGLIVDNYAGHLVAQFLTLGMEKMKDDLVRLLVDELSPESIYERSEHEGRGLEGLEPARGQLYGATPDELTVRENDMAFYVNPRAGQKTGFYLDQRDNRILVRKLTHERSVLNLFSYTGGFSVAAAAGGAARVKSVDASADALDTAKRNMSLNGANTPAEFVKADIFQFLREEKIGENFIIIDPPAMAKNRHSVDSACRGYKELHLQAAAKCPPGSLILTCSCSRFIDMNLFQMVVFEAFADAGRKASIIGKYGQPCDHPVSLFCPETEYLKSMLITVE